MVLVPKEAIFKILYKYLLNEFIIKCNLRITILQIIALLINNPNRGRKADLVKATGDALTRGRIFSENKFLVNFRDAGLGNMSLVMEGTNTTSL